MHRVVLLLGTFLIGATVGTDIPWADKDTTKQELSRPKWPKGKTVEERLTILEARVNAVEEGIWEATGLIDKQDRKIVDAINKASLRIEINTEAIQRLVQIVDRYH